MLRTLLAALLALGLCACEPTADEFIATGRQMITQKNFDGALAQFDQALALDGKNYGALWGKTVALQSQGKLPEQAELLEKILEMPEHQGRAKVLKDALEINYRKQAELVEFNEPALFEQFLRKAIAINPKSPCNEQLSNLLITRGEQTFKAGKHAEAIAAFEEAKKLRITKKVRAELDSKIEIASFQDFKRSFTERRFNAIRGEFIEKGLYDPKRQVFTVESQVEVDGKESDEGYETEAESKALRAVTSALYDLTWEVSGKPRPDDANLAYDTAQVRILDKGFVETKPRKPKQFRFKIEIPEDALFLQVGRIEDGKIKVTPTVAERLDEQNAEPEAPAEN